MYEYKDIKSIHLEVTQNCQANCPMCDRNMNGKGINPHINLDELSLEDCKRIFTPESKFAKRQKKSENNPRCADSGDGGGGRQTSAAEGRAQHHREPRQSEADRDGAPLRATRPFHILARLIGVGGRKRARKRATKDII